MIHLMTFYARVSKTSDGLTNQPVLPCLRRPPRRRDSDSAVHIFETPKAYYKQQIFWSPWHCCYWFAKQDRGMPLAVLLEKTLLNAANSSFSTIPTELEIYKHNVNFDRLNAQLKMLPELIRTYNEVNPTTCIKQVTILLTLSNVMNSIDSSKSLFSEVRKLLQTVFTIPKTSATTERTFSALQLKTLLRSSMLQSRLNNCMVLHVHKDKTDQIDLLRVTKKFINKCERRSFFGTFESWIMLK